MKVSVELNKVIMAENEKEISNSQFTVTKIIFEIDVDVDVDDYYFQPVTVFHTTISTCVSAKNQ